VSSPSSPIDDSPPTSANVSSAAKLRQRLPPLARFFPSRYRSVPRERERALEIETLPDENTSHRSTHHPDFVDLDDDDITPAPPLHSPIADIVDTNSVRREVHAAEPGPYHAGSLISDEEARDVTQYELIEPIGQGAFSCVWKARPVLPDGAKNVVAIKMVARGQLAGARRADKMRASFQREAEVLQRLAHLSLPKLHTAFSLPTHHVLVLEYIPAGELFDAINADEQHACMTEGVLRRIWTELVGVVGWMHAHDVVHRDIKLESKLLHGAFTYLLICSWF